MPKNVFKPLHAGDVRQYVVNKKKKKKIFSAYFPKRFKYFPSIWRRFCVLLTILNLSYSPYTLKYFPRILRIRLDTFSAFSIYVVYM